MSSGFKHLCKFGNHIKIIGNFFKWISKQKLKDLGLDDDEIKALMGV